LNGSKCRTFQGVGAVDDLTRTLLPSLPRNTLALRDEAIKLPSPSMMKATPLAVWRRRRTKSFSARSDMSVATAPAKAPFASNTRRARVATSSLVL
jgi:hypothetical protein